MKPLLEVEHLHVAFPLQGKWLPAVRDISFTIHEGETVGIVGESGCGKSATALSLIGLSRGKTSGKILFEGKEELAPGQKVGMVFQDPMTSLNPTMKIGSQIAEGLLYHRLADRREAKKRAIEMLHLVGIADPELRFHQYPHQLSGGMRQRVMIAIALICKPRLLIADEPTTALDVSIQLQILELLQQMQRHFQMGLLLISHDFSVVAKLCQTILVMYAGKIVERGPTQQVLKHPRHPYTQMLLQFLPWLHHSKSQPLQTIDGAPPSLLTLPPGCAFKERCPHAALACTKEPQGKIACWRIEK